MNGESLLQFRLARPEEMAELERRTIDAFEPITWMKRADVRFGPLNGKDWRARWQMRFAQIAATQMVLVGEAGGEVVALATGTAEESTRLGYIDLLCVFGGHQGKGYGRAMLRGMLAHLRRAGCVHAHLECLTTNEVGNRLYAAEGFVEVARSVRWFVEIPGE